MAKELILIKLKDGTFLYANYDTVTDTPIDGVYLENHLRNTEYVIPSGKEDGVIDVEIYINYGEGQIFTDGKLKADWSEIVYPITQDDFLLNESDMGVPHWARKRMTRLGINCYDEYNNLDLVVLKGGYGFNSWQLGVLLTEELELFREPSIVSKQGNNIYWMWSDWNLEIKDEGLVPIKTVKKWLYRRIKEEKIRQLDKFNFESGNVKLEDVLEKDTNE